MTTISRRINILLFALSAILSANAQSRSGDAYEFLDLPTTSRSTALGGQQAVLGVGEAGFFFQNPAALNDTLSGSISLNVTPLPGSITYGSASYVHHFEKLGTFALGVQYINYGSFDWTDEDENDLGTFKAQEAAIYMSYARKMTPHLTLAATLKPIFSKLESYGSFGLAMDMGAMYTSESRLLTAGILIRNLGAQVTKYHEDGEHESLNTDMRIGMTYKPEYAPFRFSLTMKDIFHWDLSTDRENSIDWGDNLMRHLVWGLEIIPIRNFFVGFGYNQRVRKELRSSGAGGMAGFSWGFGLRILKIDIAYGMRRYHLAGSANSISVSTNLNRFIKSN